MGDINGIVPIGGIIPYAGEADKVPPGWLLCDGSHYQISDYFKLFKVLNHNYSNKSNLSESTMSTITLSAINSLVEKEFAVPDCRSRFIHGAGCGKQYPNNFNYFSSPNENGDDLTERFLGWYIGSEEQVLTVDNLPRHNHSVSANGSVGGGGLVAIAFGLPITGRETGFTGNDEPFKISPSAVVLNFIIRAL